MTTITPSTIPDEQTEQLRKIARMQRHLLATLPSEDHDDEWEWGTWGIDIRLHPDRGIQFVCHHRSPGYEWVYGWRRDQDDSAQSQPFETLADALDELERALTRALAVLLDELS